MPKLKGHARNFKDWEERPAKDFDPEVEYPEADNDNDSQSSEDSADEKAGTEHYVSVGKSKLRGKDPISLGPQYRGSRVSRNALAQESDSDNDQDDEEDASESSDGSDQFADPETADLQADQLSDDAEIDSDEAFGESDEERFKKYTFRGSAGKSPAKSRHAKRATAADFMASDDQFEEDEDEDEEDDEDEEEGYRNHEMLDEEAEETSDDDGDDDEGESMDGFIDDEEEESGSDVSGQDDDDEDEDSDESEDEAPKPNKTNDRNSLKSILQAGSKSATNNLSSARQTDVTKGNAVRQQQKTFDALLNVRIRMQKSLVAINSLSVVGEDDEDESEPYEAAEAAALKLWNAIDSFRCDRSTDPTKAGQKRKREADSTTASQKMWKQMEEIEASAITRRRAVLENWSQRSRSTRTDDKSAKKFNRQAEKGLTTRLDDELEAPERLLKRTRTPRSCAPAQVARKMAEDASIYDDADFYQLLLKELVDQRTGDTAAGGAAAATIRYTAAKEAKAKKHVDTKASKGRKMRFNVHEKLQNFMAPEDRRSWEQSAVDRLFGTLFGQKLVLDEDDEAASDAEEDDEMGGVELGGDEGLRLFRS